MINTLQELVVFSRCWCVEGYHDDGPACTGRADPHRTEPVMIGCESSDIRADIVMPADCCAMPDGAWGKHLVFIGSEHIWGGDLKSVGEAVIVEEIYFMEWEPNLLKEYDRWYISLEE